MKEAFLCQSPLCFRSCVPISPKNRADPFFSPPSLLSTNPTHDSATLQEQKCPGKRLSVSSPPNGVSRRDSPLRRASPSRGEKERRPSGYLMRGNIKRPVKARNLSFSAEPTLETGHTFNNNTSGIKAAVRGRKFRPYFDDPNPCTTTKKGQQRVNKGHPLTKLLSISARKQSCSRESEGRESISSSLPHRSGKQLFELTALFSVFSMSWLGIKAIHSFSE